jgi:hypothetical protein
MEVHCDTIRRRLFNINLIFAGVESLIPKEASNESVPKVVVIYELVNAMVMVNVIIWLK